MKLLLNIMIIASILAAQTAKAADVVEKRGTAHPAVKDGLSVTVKLSNAVFAPAEPLHLGLRGRARSAVPEHLHVFQIGR